MAAVVHAAESAAMAELHSGPQHSLLALGLCLDRAFKYSDVLRPLQKKKKKLIKIKHCMCAFVCVCCVHLRAELYVCRSGSSLSGRIKGRNVFELFPFSAAVSPLHTRTPPPPRIQRVAGFIHYS